MLLSFACSTFFRMQLVKDIRVVPVFSADCKRLIESTINKLCSKYIIKYVNFFYDIMFGVTDFDDSNHLNEIGANGLSIYLAREIK